jgi:hypothetical protein
VIRRLAAVALAAGLAACTQPQPAPGPVIVQDPSPQSAITPGPPQAGAYRVAAIGTTLPARLGGFTIRRPVSYGDPALGESVSYGHAMLGAFADVYIYDHGRRPIPDGIDSSPVRQELGAAKAELELVWPGRAGAGPLSFLGERVVRHGAAAFLELRYRGVMFGGEVESRLLITGYRNQFIKLRITVPRPVLDAAPDLIDGFIRDLAAVLVP